MEIIELKCCVVPATKKLKEHLYIGVAEGDWKQDESHHAQINTQKWKPFQHFHRCLRNQPKKALSLHGQF